MSFIKRGLSRPERCRYVADLIEENPDLFDMDFLGLDEDGESVFYEFDLTAKEAAFLLRWHADEISRR